MKIFPSFLKKKIRENFLSTSHISRSIFSSSIISLSKAFKMIGWKTIITTISVLTYVVLLHTFYELHFGRDESEVNCEWHSPCIRFCSEDRNETKQLLIKFNQEFIRDGRENNYSIHKSEPSCLDTTVNYGKSNYRIDAVSYKSLIYPLRRATKCVIFDTF